MNEQRLLVFVRLPEIGKVKTRLARTMGDEAALALYRCFVADTLALARQSAYPFTVCFHPPEAHRAVTEWLGTDASYMPQTGGDVGERMYAAFCTALSDARRVVLIGSDIPGLPPEMLHEAFASLDAHDAVIGPASDGGYYLIGFTAASILPASFSGIAWGSPAVFRSTMDILHEHDVDVHVLPPWNDVDEYGDLESFFASRKDLPVGALYTVDFLRARFGSILGLSAPSSAEPRSLPPQPRCARGLGLSASDPLRGWPVGRASEPPPSTSLRSGVA